MFHLTGDTQSDRICCSRSRSDKLTIRACLSAVLLLLFPRFLLIFRDDNILSTLRIYNPYRELSMFVGALPRNRATFSPLFTLIFRSTCTAREIILTLSKHTGIILFHSLTLLKRQKIDHIMF